MNTSTAQRLKSDVASERRTIDGLHRTKTGKVSNKWSSYLSYYDELFSSRKDDPIRLFEIGIQNGGSLETWSSYFKNAQSITGCDIDEKCRQLKYDDPRVSVIVGNANTTSIFQEAIAKGPFDVIIDDGSHLSEDILASFLNYFPTLAPGGIYVVEDTHAVYQRAATNIHNKANALDFFKALTDVVNYQFWFSDEKIENLLAPYMGCAVPAFLTAGWIHSVAFQNSIVTIRKALSPNHHKLGDITISGDVADVDPEPLRIKLARQLHAI